MSHVALLRGINVGGKNILPMKDLAAMFTDLGCRDVRTYIQSGNIVFKAGAPLAKRLSALAGAAISKRFGFEPPVIIRSIEELRVVAKNNPYLKRNVDAKRLHVGFLLDTPDRAGVAALDPNRSPADEFTVRGREVYFHFPNGLGRSKLTSQYFDSRLKTVMTVRNWNTVQALLEMAEGD